MWWGDFMKQKPKPLKYLKFFRAIVENVSGKNVETENRWWCIHRKKNSKFMQRMGNSTIIDKLFARRQNGEAIVLHRALMGMSRAMQEQE